jgi:hypothetical protein
MDWKPDGQSEVVLHDDTGIAELAERRLSEDQLYRFYFREITCKSDGGTLTLRGRVPTFYLKQVLQTMLGGLEGVDRIDNQVDVVNSEGLSSVRRVSPK